MSKTNSYYKPFNVEKKDCTGLYLYDYENTFKDKDLNKDTIKVLNYKDITILIKFYFNGKTKKKTLRYKNITASQAVDDAITQRSLLKQTLQSTGVIAPKRSNLTLNDVWEKYLNQVMWSDDTFKSNRGCYRSWIKPNIGDMYIDKVLTTDMQDCVKRCLAAGRKERTAHKIKQILSPLYEFAIDNGFCEKNPSKKVVIPKYDNKQVVLVKEEQRLKLLEAIKNYPIDKYKGIMLFIYYGRRVSEAMKLKWENIYFDSDCYVLYGKDQKNDETVALPLMKLLKDFLVNYDVDNQTGYIFKGVKTDRVTIHTFRRHWKKVCENAGMDKPLRAHSTRHMLATTLINKKQPMEVVSKLLTHSSTKVTEEIYVTLEVNTKRDVLEEY